MRNAECGMKTEMKNVECRMKNDELPALL